MKNFRGTKLAAAVFLTASIFFSAPAYCDNSGVNFSVNADGIASLSYNGQEMLTPQDHDTIVTDILFVAPDKTQKPYGWRENSLGSINIGSSDRTSGNSPAYFQQIYREGLDDSFTLKVMLTAPDTQTVKMDFYVTNNDKHDTLQQFGIEYFMEMTTPGIDQYGWLAVAALDVNAQPSAFASGSWGSMAFYTDDYSKNSEFYDVWTNEPTQDTVNYLWRLQNTSSPGGVASNAKFDPIAPEKTYHYALYIRFGTQSDTAATLASKGYNAFRKAYPYLVNWPDRSPVARWFLAGEQFISAGNPRGWNSSIDTSSQENFTASLLHWADLSIAYFNSLAIKPQGVVFWDLEGEEFYQPFTYVGYPNKLHDLAPEMDAAADQFMKKFTDAGYMVGMTLRPSSFITGATLPSSCHYDSSSDNLGDVFVLTTAPAQNRGYRCDSTGHYVQAGYRLPAYQTVSDDDAVTLATLEGKVRYAHKRWGAKLFYVDSTVYHGGNSLSFLIFRQLQKDFPDCLFIPENKRIYYWGAAAPYGDTRVYGDYGAPSYASFVYPEAFSVTESYDVDLTPNQSNYTTLTAGIKNGNALFMDGWFDDEPNNGYVQQMYHDAGYAQPKPRVTVSAHTASSSMLLSVQISNAKKLPELEPLRVNYYFSAKRNGKFTLLGAPLSKRTGAHTQASSKLVSRLGFYYVKAVGQDGFTHTSATFRKK